ncbi:UTP--glucose-1-phosphate uridylyltransferase GalU [bacterium]|jgi:UTP--glucose-1-phosphate uridylyltransferase|nr:UTP--glucose-1-phosphate uridylyltransferase GalU [bacterium]
MKKIKKVVIPAAGLGTRFFPITKSIPKEMLPIIDVPVIQVIIDEAVKAGLEEVIIVNSRDKKATEHYFQADEDLEKMLLAKGQEDLVKLLKQIETKVKITFTYQDNPQGLGHAVLCAKEAVGDEPFAVLLGDDIVVNYQGEPAIKQLMRVYEEVNCSIVGVQEVAKEDVSKYGIVKALKMQGRLSELCDLVEKPAIEEAPSCLAILGCYILTPKIFELLATQERGAGNEIQLTDAIKRLVSLEGVYAYNFEGQRFDVGDKLGYVMANINFALHRKEYRKPLLAYLKEEIEKETI